MRCTVIGAGAWGTALADVLARNGHGVALWAYEPDVVEAVNARHENVRFLPKASLHPALRATSSFEDALTGAMLVCFATPSQHLRAIARKAAPHLEQSATVCVASKGIERDTLALRSDVVEAEARGRPVVALESTLRRLQTAR